MAIANDGCRSSRRTTQGVKKEERAKDDHARIGVVVRLLLSLKRRNFGWVGDEQWWWWSSTVSGDTKANFKVG